ncbi:ABA4-like family protein [Dongia sp.]|uniref:ABA4-like family protein n=1 Tax=Dongia sp. TaxID=1977262 RepID=UPI0035B4BEE5
MIWEDWFSAAGSLAMLGWASLILLPRRGWILAALRHGAVGLLALLYAVLILGYFFDVEGGGFGSIAEVRALFMSDPVLLAGWVHYLAFDLFVGLWIAERADALGIHRLLQAPVLAATFMFGPIGLLLHLGLAAGLRLGKKEAVSW